jgi:hypothetical protein
VPPLQPPGYDHAPWSETPHGPLQPGYEQPGYEQPGYEQSSYEQPGYEHLGYAPPGYEPPGYEQPGYEQSNYEQPGYEQPGYEQSSYEQPGYEQSGYEHPGFEAHQQLEPPPLPLPWHAPPPDLHGGFGAPPWVESAPVGHGGHGGGDPGQPGSGGAKLSVGLPGGWERREDHRLLDDGVLPAAEGDVRQASHTLLAAPPHPEEPLSPPNPSRFSSIRCSSSNESSNNSSSSSNSNNRRQRWSSQQEPAPLDALQSMSPKDKRRRKDGGSQPH